MALALPLNVKDAAEPPDLARSCKLSSPIQVRLRRSRVRYKIAAAIRSLRHEVPAPHRDSRKERSGLVCVVDRERALTAAQVLQQEAQSGLIRGPLHGVPVAIKDVIDVAGRPTRAGSKTRAQIAPSTIDAQIVGRLRIAGAIILGKVHTTEFACFDSPPPTRKPPLTNKAYPVVNDQRDVTLVALKFSRRAAGRQIRLVGGAGS
jgi:Amidase